MIAYILDENQKTREELNRMVSELLTGSVVTAFDTFSEALEVFSIDLSDVFFLDIDHLSIPAEELVRRLRKIHKETNVIFVSKKEAGKALAFDCKASGYLTRPVTEERIREELSDLRYPVSENSPLLRIQCFGNFSVYRPDGQIVRFSRSKAKELLAYLIYKKGSDVSTRELGAVLFEDKEYDEKQQRYLQQLFFTLNKDLKAVGAEEVLTRNYNSTSVKMNRLDCDYFRFLNDDESVKKSYTGEFMMQYEWSEYVTAYLDQMATEQK